jgi:2,4-dienoyl-CoA reductase (NADPH2)
VDLRLSTRADLDALRGFDAVVLATGVHPRRVDFPGADHAKVLSYVDVLQGAPVGRRVAIVGAGGIGFDVAEFLVHPPGHGPDRDAFLAAWGVDPTYAAPGALTEPAPPAPAREVFLCQRSPGRLGRGLGKTTGWIHRASLKKAGVTELSGCEYLRVDEAGLHLRREGRVELLEVDHVVICAGQVPARELEAPLRAAGLAVHRIGGADEAAELDARRAIEQGTRVGSTL